MSNGEILALTVLGGIIFRVWQRWHRERTHERVVAYWRQRYVADHLPGESFTDWLLRNNVSL